MASTDKTFLTTGEVAELLRVKERKVYDLAANKRIPCRKLTGKLLFPREEILEWLGSNSLSGSLSEIATLQNEGAEPGNRKVPLIILGSHDPLLESALRESSSYLPTLFDSSMGGLDKFEQGLGSIAGLHVMEDSVHGWNTGLVTSRFGSRPVVLLEWAKRQRGILYRSQGKQMQVKSADVCNLDGLSLVARQSGAGSQKLFEKLLLDGRFGTNPGITTAMTALTEQEAATSVLEGKADFAFGLYSMARRLNLEFIPIVEERFDLLLERRAFFETEFQKFFRYCQSDSFSRLAKELGGYDISAIFRVHHNGP